MPNRRRLPAAVVLTLAASCSPARCNRVETPPQPALQPSAQASSGEPTAAPNSASESLFSTRSILCSLAVYHVPRPTTPVRPVVEAWVKKSSPALRVGDKPSPDMELPVVFVVPMSTKEYVPPNSEYLRTLGRGLSDEDKRQVAVSQEATMLNFFWLPPGLDILQKSGALALEVARKTGGLLWDESTSETFTPEAWEKRRLQHWSNGLPVVQDYLTIYDEAQGSGGVSLVTHGMGTFGLPDLLIETKDKSHRDALGSLINLTAQVLLEQGSLAYDGKLVIDLDAVKNDLYRQSYAVAQADLPRKLEVQLRWKKRTEDDDKNRILRLVSPESVGLQLAAIKRAAKQPLPEKTFSVAPDRTDLTDASRRATERLRRDIKPLFLKGLGPDTKLFVKAPFRDAEGNKEFMWLLVKGWKGESLRGELINQPEHVPGLKQGSEVTVNEPELYDYLLVHQNGDREGGETDELLQKEGDSP